MIALKRYYLACRILATMGLLYLGLYQAITNPGPQDSISGLVTGLCIYTIWFNKERQK